MKIQKIVNLFIFINSLIIIILISKNIFEEINAFVGYRRGKRKNILYCNYCDEQLQNNQELFVDILDFTFCNRDFFFRKLKKARKPEVHLLQEQFDIHSPRFQIYNDSYKYQHLL